MSRIEHDILKMIEGGPITPAALNKTVSRKFRMAMDEVKPIVRHLIAQGRLAYSDNHGRTVIEKSFLKPVRISAHVMLKPPAVNFSAQKEDVLLEMAQGAAFGDGRHPSTRVAVRALEHVLKNTLFLQYRTSSKLLDIGTGSGILAIAALHLGITTAVGIDIDPAARYEAAQNAQANGVETRFEILDAPLEGIRDRFDMIAANLRYPTLIRISSTISDLLKPSGAVVLSGIKIEESGEVTAAYTSRRFTYDWHVTENDWRSLVFCR